VPRRPIEINPISGLIEIDPACKMGLRNLKNVIECEKMRSLGVVGQTRVVGRA